MREREGLGLAEIIKTLKPNLTQSSSSYMVLDYVLSAINGMRADKYVPYCTKCVNNTKYFEIDAQRFEITYWTTDKSTAEGFEKVFFNFTATISGYLPDAIYYCYFIP
jgi:hypothetical protein